MSEPASSTSAQNLDLGALGDALGAPEDGTPTTRHTVKDDDAAYKIGGEDEEEDGSQNGTSKEAAPATSKTSLAAKSTDKAESPATLSPSSLRSMSPQPTPEEPRSNRQTASKVSQSNQNPRRPAPAQPTELQDKIKAVKGMFPSLDEDTVAAVLAAENGDEENAVNVLLSMSDPSATPEPPSRGLNNQRGQTGAMTDEELARSLALEEDEAYARAAQAQEEQRRYAHQQSQPGGRRGGGGGVGSGGSTGMLSDFFGGMSSGGRGGGAGGAMPGGRGGGGASSFFTELKQSVQPLFDGKGPLHRDSNAARTLDGSRQSNITGGSGGNNGLAGSTPNSYDPTRLTYQPRVRKGAAPGSGPPASSFGNQPSSVGSAGAYGGRYGTPAGIGHGNYRQPNPPSQGAPGVQSRESFQPIRVLGGDGSANDSSARQYGATSTVDGRTTSARDTGKARAIPVGAAAVGGAVAGSALASAANSGSGSNADDSEAPPASIASVLEQGRSTSSSGVSSGGTPRLGTDFEDDDDDDDDADDLGSDDLEFQKSPFDDED